MFFVQDPPRSRRFTVKGIYNAQLDDVVNALIICDIKHIRRLNGWNEGEASSVEVFIDNLDRLDEVSDAIDEQQAGTMTEEKGRLKVQTVKDLYPHLFDWLYLLDTNVWIILILMLCVAGFNMISGLLILVFERTSMIGLLKTLGMQNSGIQRIFLYRAAFITLRGLFWGNITGIFLCILQQRFHFIALDASNYYTDSVPVLLQPAPLILVNLCGFAGIILLLALPVFVISHITPDRTLKTE
jgi:lipoprotein-releasing system permease protein